MMDKEQEVQTRIVKGLVDYIILEQLNTKEVYGYELISNFQKFFGVKYTASFIYPFLTAMEKNGCICGSWNTEGDKPRKMYKLTDDGERVRVLFREKIEALLQKLDNLDVADFATQNQLTDEDV